MINKETIFFIKSVQCFWAFLDLVTKKEVKENKKQTLDHWGCQKVLQLPLHVPYIWDETSSLKAMDTIGNCQKLAFTVGISQHMQKITNLWNFELNRSTKLRDNNERRKNLVTRSWVRLDGWFRDLKFYIWGLEIKFVENYFFLENYGTSEEAVCNVLCYQPLLITRHKVRFYANNNFE